MFKLMTRSAINLVVLSFSVVFLASCAASGKVSVGKNAQNAQKVEKLQENSEYSAVDSEWNEMYQ